MKRLSTLAPLAACMLALGHAHAQRSFGSLAELTAYVEANSYTLRSAPVKLEQARRAKRAAVWALPDAQPSVSFNFTDNTKLPVSLFPAEILGGPAGTFREVRLGLPYNTTATQSGEFKLLNYKGHVNLRLARLNLESTENDNLQTRKALRDNVASLYYNLLQLAEQSELIRQNLSAADTLLQIARQKYKEGVVSSQDVTEAEISRLTQAQSLSQLGYQAARQQNALKILADAPDTATILLTEKLALWVPPAGLVAAPSVLDVRALRLQRATALGNLRKADADLLPTLSIVGSNSFNQYNQAFTITGGRWIQSQYVGVKLNYTLPNATTLATRANARYNAALAQLAARQAESKAELDTRQTDLEYRRAAAERAGKAQLLSLHRQAYLSNRRRYIEGLAGLERALDGFSAMTNAGYALAAAQAAEQLAAAKISINNDIR